MCLHIYMCLCVITLLLVYLCVQTSTCVYVSRLLHLYLCVKHLHVYLCVQTFTCVVVCPDIYMSMYLCVQTSTCVLVCSNFSMCIRLLHMYWFPNVHYLFGSYLLLNQHVLHWIKCRVMEIIFIWLHKKKSMFESDLQIVK